MIAATLLIKGVPTAFLWPVESSASTMSLKLVFRVPANDTNGSAGDVDVRTGMPSVALRSVG